MLTCFESLQLAFKTFTLIICCSLELLDGSLDFEDSSSFYCRRARPKMVMLQKGRQCEDAVLSLDVLQFSHESSPSPAVLRQGPLHPSHRCSPSTVDYSALLEGTTARTMMLQPASKLVLLKIDKPKFSSA